MERDSGYQEEVTKDIVNFGIVGGILGLIAGAAAFGLAEIAFLYRAFVATPAKMLKLAPGH